MKNPKNKIINKFIKLSMLVKILIMIAIILFLTSSAIVISGAATNWKFSLHNKYILTQDEAKKDIPKIINNINNMKQFWYYSKDSSSLHITFHTLPVWIKSAGPDGGWKFLLLSVPIDRVSRPPHDVTLNWKFNTDENSNDIIKLILQDGFVLKK